MQVNISYIRDLTGILDPDSLENIMIRFEQFCEDQFMEVDKEAWDMFWKPVSWNEFMALSGTKFNYVSPYGVEEAVEYLQPLYHDFIEGDVGFFGPEHVYTSIKHRDNTFTSTSDLNYPVDSDIKIYVTVKGEERIKNVLVSYNELVGLSKSGREPHWSEPHSYKYSGAKGYDFDHNPKKELNSSMYLKTPVGQPKVDDLIKRGTVVQSNYCDTVYIVDEVTLHKTRPMDADSEHAFETYSLALIDRETLKGGYGIHNLIAFDGKIIRHDATKSDEISILEHLETMPDTIKQVDDDDEEEHEEPECCTVECSTEENVEVPQETRPEPIVPLSTPSYGEQLALF